MEGKILKVAESFTRTNLTSYTKEEDSTSFEIQMPLLFEEPHLLS